MTAASLVIEKLEIRLHGQRLIGLDAAIAPGEVLSLMGPSGCGKSTLIAVIAGLLPTAFTSCGQIRLADTDLTGLPPEERRIGILFQDPLVFAHFSVVENVMFAMPKGGNRAERYRRAKELLETVDLAGLADRDPTTLSGGQKTRLALVRVLASQPAALLLDEPFSGLDTELRDAVRRLVFDTARNNKLPVLLVTHDRADAEAAGGPVVTV